MPDWQKRLMFCPLPTRAENWRSVQACAYSRNNCALVLFAPLTLAAAAKCRVALKCGVGKSAKSMTRHGTVQFPRATFSESDADDLASVEQI